MPKHIFWPIFDSSGLYATRVTRGHSVVLRRIGGRGHFWSRDKNGGHTIRSAIAEKPLLQANITDLSSIDPELLPKKRDNDAALALGARPVQQYVTMAPNVGPRQISTDNPSMPCIWLKARTSMLSAFLLTTAVPASSFLRLPKESLASRRNCSEQLRNRQA